MRRAIVPALLLVLVSVVLGATVFREQVAQAAATLMVREQNTDAQGNIKVHEQGTAAVRAANEEVTVQKKFSETQANFCAGDIYTVPAGKRLVVEYIGLAAAGGNAPYLHANLFIDSDQ